MRTFLRMALLLAVLVGAFSVHAKADNNEVYQSVISSGQFPHSSTNTTYAFSNALTGSVSSAIDMSTYSGLFASVSGTSGANVVVVQWCNDGNTTTGYWATDVGLPAGTVHWYGKQGRWVRFKITTAQSALQPPTLTVWYSLENIPGSGQFAPIFTTSGIPQASYIVSIPNIAPPASATDFWGIYNPPGSGTALEAIDATFGCYINGGGSFPGVVYRRTALDAGGNSTNVTIGMTDPTMPAASFSAAYYTSNPTSYGGTTATVAVYEFQANTNSFDDPLLADGNPWILRPGQVWYFNCNGNTIGGISHNVYIRQIPLAPPF